MWAHGTMRRELKHIAFATLFLIIVPFASCTRPNTPTEQARQLISAGMEVEDSDAVSALDLYEEAIDVMAGKPDSTVLRMAHLHMSLLFMRYGLAEECIEAMHEAYIIDSIRCDTTAMLYSLRYMALAHESRGRIELAQGILKQVITGMPPTHSDIYNHIYDDYYQRYEDMRNIIERQTEYHKQALSQLTPKSEEVGTAALAWKAESENNFKRAIIQYKLLANSFSPYIQAYALIQQTILYLQLGQTQEAAKSLTLYEAALNRLNRKQDLAKSLLQHHACYKENRSQQKITHLRHVNQIILAWMLPTIVACLLVIIILILSIRVYRQRQTILKFRIDKLRQWRAESMAQKQKDKAQKENDIRQSEIYLSLHHHIEDMTHSNLDKEEWDKLEETVLQFYPLFRTRLQQLAQVSAHDYRVCLLLKIGMKPSEIATLTLRSNEAISSSRRRLYYKATGQKGSPNEWDRIIESL